MFQLSPPSDPNYKFEIFKAVLGPLIAAVVFIIGLLWRDRIERRQAAQEWFEQTYITDGLDVVADHLTTLSHLTNESRRLMFGHIPVQPLPYSVPRKLMTFHLFDFLTGVDTAQAVILASMRKDHPIHLTHEESLEILSLCIGLYTYAETIRGFLLETKIKMKSDVYKIPKNFQFTELLTTLNKTFLEETDLTSLNKVLMSKFRDRIGETAKALRAEKE